MRFRRRHRFAVVVVLAVASALALTAFGSAQTRASNEIVIGASVPLSGPLAGFGSFVQWGYKHAVAGVNAKGGLRVGGHKEKVKLIIYDDKTDPNQVAANVQRLISKDHVVALLGSCTPALTNAGAVVADRARMPYVTGCDPLESFTSVKKWQYAWDVFFSVPDLIKAPFQTLAAWHAKTNKKVAVLADNGPDGVIAAKLYQQLAPKFGYKVVYHASFPVNTTVFGSLIESAKSSGADVLMVDAVTPPAVAFTKQLAAANYHPKLLVIEKGSEPVQYAQALGKLANGVIVGGYWDPSFPYPGAKTLRKLFEKQTHQTWSQHIADSTAVAQILMDAISRAGSTDAAKINTALAKTNKTYVVGHVKFSAAHTAKLPIAEDQWQNGKTVVVWPRKKATGKLLFPRP